MTAFESVTGRIVGKVSSVVVRLVVVRVVVVAVVVLIFEHVSGR